MDGGAQQGQRSRAASSFGEARAQLLAAIAARLGRPVEDLRGWVDYDPITVDETAIHMSRGNTGVRWSGD